MPSLNFKKQFAPDVESGKKRQTIRPKRKHPVKVGDKLYLFTGLRTKVCRRLVPPFIKFTISKDKPAAICKSVHDIEILNVDHIKYRGVDLYAGSEPWKLKLAHTIATDDGFAGTQEMVDFFKEQYGLPFHGDLIKW